MKEFKENKTTTSTTIMTTNLQINLIWLLNSLPIISLDEHDHEQVSRCKKKKNFNQLFAEIKPPNGTFIMVKYKDILFGYAIQKKKKKKKTKHFRNSLNVVIFVDKLITLKIPNKGNFQFTGCSSPEHSEKVIKYLWNFLSQHEQSDNTYKILGEHLIAKDVTVMTNIVFNIGFKVDKQRLDTHINTLTEFRSILETSIDYTGVNIKLPFSISDEKIVKIMELRDGKWSINYITFDEHIKSLDCLKQSKELNKVRKNTFLVFYSGTVIMSGMNRIFMKNAYYKFLTILRNSKHLIEEDILE